MSYFKPEPESFQILIRVFPTPQELAFHQQMLPRSTRELTSPRTIFSERWRWCTDSSCHLSCGYFWEAFCTLLRGSSRIKLPVPRQDFKETCPHLGFSSFLGSLSLPHTSASWGSRPLPSNPWLRHVFQGDLNQDGVPIPGRWCELGIAPGVSGGGTLGDKVGKNFRKEVNSKGHGSHDHPSFHGDSPHIKFLELLKFRTKRKALHVLQEPMETCDLLTCVAMGGVITQWGCLRMGPSLSLVRDVPQPLLLASPGCHQ